MLFYAVKNVIINKITEDTGAQSRYILESADKKIKSDTSLKSLLNDIYIVSESFNNDKVKYSFELLVMCPKNLPLFVLFQNELNNHHLHQMMLSVNHVMYLEMLHQHLRYYPYII